MKRTPATNMLSSMDPPLRTILVTGGTGSCGQALLRRLLTSDLEEIRLFSRDEQKHFALACQFRDPRIRWIIGDVRDGAAVRRAVRGVDAILHTAAMKHVPLVENHVYEACRTNIDGVWNVLRAAEDEGVRRVVAISTDKAVSPVNAMGMTKALQERLVCSYRSHNPALVCCCVRYGNVLASKGSVVPFFLERLRRGERVLPVTHPEMTRFLLTLDQAVDLVLFALARGGPGQLFVSRLRSISIVDLAEVMLDAFGGGSWTEVGIRPGEKIHEILVTAEELGRAQEVIDDIAGHRYYRIDRARHGDPVGHRAPLSSGTCERMDKTEIRELLVTNGLLPSRRVGGG